MKIKSFLLILLFALSLQSCLKEPHTPTAYASITSLNQPSYTIQNSYVDTNGVYHQPVMEFGMIEMWYSVQNTGFREIHNFSVIFAVLLNDGSYIYAEGNGTGVRDYSTSYLIIDTYGVQARNVVITSCEVK